MNVEQFSQRPVLKELPEAIRCAECGADVTPFTFTHGYTMALDSQKELGVTLHQDAAEKVVRDGRYYMYTGTIDSKSIVTFAPHDLTGAIARLRPFLGSGNHPFPSFP